MEEDSPIPRPFLTESGTVMYCLFKTSYSKDNNYNFNRYILTHSQTTLTMNSTNPSHWEAPKFSIKTEDQAAEWKQFYIHALDYLETLDIDPDKQDENKRGWCQIKMFQGDDRQTL